MIVGSITTGYTRAGSVNHPPSAVTVTVVTPPDCDTRWVTLSDHTFPTGEEASSRSSYINGAGITTTGSPPDGRTNAIDPSSRCSATSPRYAA